VHFLNDMGPTRMGIKLSLMLLEHRDQHPQMFPLAPPQKSLNHIIPKLTLRQKHDPASSLLLIGHRAIKRLN
jgi:hypothetical protein